MKKSKLIEIMNLMDEIDEPNSEPGDYKENGLIGSPDRLKEIFKQYDQKYEFQPGMIVCWKSQLLSNKGVGGYDDPMIVVKTLEPPILDTASDSGSAYFNEKLDIVVGFIDDDEEFLFLHLDSKRLKKSIRSNELNGETA
jgi:hypothetical protein